MLKASLDLPATPASARHHLVRRLARAVARAESLVSLLTALGSRVSVQDRAQAAAYELVLRGTLSFEQKKHQDGLNTLAVAHQLLATLASTAPTAHGEALANEMIDDVEPMLRFCAYSLQIDTSQGTAALVEQTAAKEQERLVPGFGELVAALESASREQQRETVELSWRGAAIPVRNAQLVDVVVKVKAALATLEADKDLAQGSSRKTKKSGAKREVMGARRMGTYDKALLILGEGEDVARQLVEDNKVRSTFLFVRFTV